MTRSTVRLLMPWATASGANSVFQSSKPAAVLLHEAANAPVLMENEAARNANATTTLFAVTIVPSPMCAAEPAESPQLNISLP
jgi:hypothetical protein